MSKTKQAQSSFFDQTQEDLPLFSGTAQRGKVTPFTAKPKARQETFAKCHACKDTGKIGFQDCWCACSASQDRARIIKDAMLLSSGTMANLIDDPNYETIDAAQNAWVQWLTEGTQTFKNWRQAWDAFAADTP